MGSTFEAGKWQSSESRKRYVNRDIYELIEIIKVSDIITVYKSESPTLIATMPQKSVAERIQELGSAATQSNGFSTKINVSMSSATANASNWEDNGKFFFFLFSPFGLFC